MNLIPDIKLQTSLKHRAKLLSLIVSLIGFLVLVGWQFDIEFLKRMIAGFVAMNPLSACCFILLSASFLLLTGDQNKRSAIFAGYLIAAIVLTIGLLKSLDLVFNFNIKPDLLFYARKIKESTIYGRPNFMAPNTAICFLLSGLSLLLLHTRSGRKLPTVQLIALIVSFLGLLSILGYIYQVRSFYEVPLFIPMALPTAICFFFIGISILLAQPAKGVMRDFTSTSSGSINAHALIPAAIIVPTFLGLFRLYGDWAGLYTKEFGVAVFALSNIIVFLGLIWYNSILLNKRDLLKKESEEALEKSRQEIIYLGGLVEKSSDGIISMDADFKIKTWNKGAESIYGFTAGEVMGKDLRELLKSDTSVSQLDELRAHIQSQGYWTGEINQVSKLGEPVICLISTTGLMNENEITTGYLTIVKDITERKRKENLIIESEAKLKKVNEEMEAFTYSVSHDLRAPLRSIVGFTSILEDDYTSKLDDEAKRLMGVIKRNTLKMGTLIDDLLTFSKLSKQDIIKTNIDTNELVNEVIAELDNKHGHANIEWCISEMPAMYADVNSIRQVWINLVSNAIKYSGKKTDPKIIIKGHVEKHQTYFSIQDNGVGFDQKYSNKLFKVFQRLHGASEFEGTGVGLAIVEKIIAKHGGKIEVEAEQDKGAKFYFKLPSK
ncbi:MAG: ATP-binding protein [Ferruginibacter sp.]